MSFSIPLTFRPILCSDCLQKADWLPSYYLCKECNKRLYEWGKARKEHYELANI